MNVEPFEFDEFPEPSRPRAELEAFRRMLDASQGCFSLSIAVCNTPVLREYLISELKAEHPGINIVFISPGTIDVFGVTETEVIGEKCAALFVIGLEQSISSTDQEQRTLRSLNASRELWEHSFHCPVVFWLPEYAASLLITHAPDFWRYRSHRFEFVSEQANVFAGMQDNFARDYVVAAALSKDEKQFRITELEQRLAEIGMNPTGDMIEHAMFWSSELGYLYNFSGNEEKSLYWYEKSLQFCLDAGQIFAGAAILVNIGYISFGHGRYDEALQYYEKSIQITRQLESEAGTRTATDHSKDDHSADMRRKYIRYRAFVQSRIAEVMEERGKWEEALRIYRIEVLPAYELQGDVLSIAITKGKIADIMQKQGRLDEALRIYREEQLPVFERLGDIHSQATTQGRIAGILLLRGDIDEALRIYLEEQLPVFERLGDVYSSFMCKSNIALSLLNRNKSGDINQALILLHEARDAAVSMGFPEVNTINSIIASIPQVQTSRKL